MSAINLPFGSSHPPTSHQSIGSHGSFWLPPKSQASDFDLHLEKHFSDSGKKSRSNSPSEAPLPASVKVPGGNMIDRGRGEAMQTLNRVGEKAAAPASMKGHLSVGLADSGVSSGTFISPRAGSPASLDSSFGLEVGSKRESPLISPDPFSLPGKSGGPRNHPSKHFSQTSGSLGAGLSTGARTAYTQVRDNEDKPFTHRTQEPFLFEKLSDPDSFSDALGEQVLDLCLTGFSSEKQVFRMAFNLFDGSSVSMRIERIDTNLSLAFVCDRPSGRDFLRSALLPISRSFSSHPEFAVHAQVFSSYHEMDSVLRMHQPSLP